MTPKNTVLPWLEAQVKSDRSREECWTDWPFAKNRFRGNRPTVTRPITRETVHAGRAALFFDGKPFPGSSSEFRGGKIEMCHNCDNPECYNPSHLRWDTERANVQEAYDRGLNPNRKLSSAQVLQILHHPGTQREIAKIFGISQSYVCQIKTGIYRSSVTGVAK